MGCHSQSHIVVSVTDISAAASQLIDIRGGCCVEIVPKTQAVWAKIGTAAVTATAGTAGEEFVPASAAPPYHRCRSGSFVNEAGDRAHSHVAIIQDAATADGSVAVLG